MDNSKFSNLCASKVVLLDGATGTELQKRGMPNGICLEKWVLENKDVLIQLQKEYLDSGSDIIYACTFGANRFKLRNYGLENEVIDYNKSLVEISRQVILNKKERAYVAGSLAPTGQMIYPLGETLYEDILSSYKEQARGLIAGVVNLFVIETMISVQEARAAILAIKECCSHIIMVSITIEENGKMLTGTDPISALITLQSLGIDAFGINCSTGPDKIVDYIKMLKPYASVPLFAKPNAGVPVLENGITKFNMSPDKFAQYSSKLVKNGANLIGGCCGTSPEYILELARNVNKLYPSIINCTKKYLLSSATKIFDIVDNDINIGYDLNYLKNADFKSFLDEDDFYEIIDIATEQEDAGCTIININISQSITEEVKLIEIINKLSYSVKSPLCFESSRPKIVEAALRIYQGRGIVNCLELNQKEIFDILPVAVYYGAMLMLTESFISDYVESSEIDVIIKDKLIGIGYCKDGKIFVNLI